MRPGDLGDGRRRPDGPRRPAEGLAEQERQRHRDGDVRALRADSARSPTPRSSTTRRCRRSSSGRRTCSSCRRLALRNGFECYVDGDTGYFGPPSSSDARPARAGRAVRRRDHGQPASRSRSNALTPADVVDVPGRPDHRRGPRRDRRLERPAVCSAPTAAADTASAPASRPALVVVGADGRPPGGRDDRALPGAATTAASGS